MVKIWDSSTDKYNLAEAPIEDSTVVTVHPPVLIELFTPLPPVGRVSDEPSSHPDTKMADLPAPRCTRCGRKLKSPKSIERSMGRICTRKAEIEANRK